MIQAALRRRKNRLLFLIDIAVPRDIDPAAGGVDNVYLHNIDDLQAVVDENIRGRLGEAEKAERIIDDEVVKFSEWLNTLEVVPTIVSLREKAEAIMKDELEKTLAGMRHLADGEKKNIEILASSIVKKILHDPITGLKEESQNGSAIPFVAVMRRLFKLDPK
jgi:glutamyl-tRNA reductase